MIRLTDLELTGKSVGEGRPSVRQIMQSRDD